MEKEAAGRREELAFFINKYADTVYRTALSCVKSEADAEDIMQEVFLRFFLKGPDFESEDHARAWFIRVALNAGRSLLKSAWFRHRTGLNESLPAPEPPTPDCVRPAVGKLPGKYRTVIQLYYYEGYSIREIARLADMKENTVKTNLRRAKKLLKERLGDDYEGF